MPSSRPVCRRAETCGSPTASSCPARTDERTADLKLSNPQSTARLTVGTAAGPITLPRGWASVDVKIRGTSFRFVTTHLEAFAPPIRNAQPASSSPVDLHDPDPLTKRVDLVLTTGGFDAVAADVVGENTADRTETGLRPSDHAGVVVTLLRQERER